MSRCVYWALGAIEVSVLTVALPAYAPRTINGAMAAIAESNVPHRGEELMLAEQLKHTARLARLLTMHQLASEDDYTEAVSLIESLIEREYKRHNEALAQIERVQIHKDSDDANDVWWKDIGRKNPDSNATGFLEKNHYGLIRVLKN